MRYNLYERASEHSYSHEIFRIKNFNRSKKNLSTILMCKKI